MDGKTRKRALDKAKSMTSHVGYPDELLDDKKLELFYKNLEIRDDDYFNANLNLTLFGLDEFLDRLRKPVNKSYWVDHSASAVDNAWYNPNENSISMSILILKLL